MDEIDKMGMDHRGDPASALLEVLDPEQNDCFNDHYLDLDYDLSKCMFVATANSAEQIPGPLLDRTELMRLSGYTEIEKLEIVKKFILPKQIKENGLEEGNFDFTDSAIMHVIRYYTRESGVRQIEREIASIVRKVIRKNMKKILTSLSSIKNRELKKVQVKNVSSISCLNFTEQVTPKIVEECLGIKKFHKGVQFQESKIGLCNGLAWTPYGGDVLVIEVAILPGKGKLMITGKLGDVMQESAQAALSYVRSRSEFLGISNELYNEIDIHIHVPEGAVPKDGPSAGLCMATALTSAIIKRPVSNKIAMTGEITLSGRSLPIGGLKEKALAAHRYGIKKVLFPVDNLKDLSSIPESIRNDIDFISVRHMDDVLIHSLVWDGVKSEKNSLYLKLIKNTKCIENSTYTVN